MCFCGVSVNATFFVVFVVFCFKQRYIAKKSATAYFGVLWRFVVLLFYDRIQEHFTVPFIELLAIGLDIITFP